MNKAKNSRYLFLTVLIVIAAASRLLPHLPNFSPIAAIALFGGACFNNKKLAYFIPLLIMILSDVALEAINGIGFHNTMIYVYVGFILTTSIGVAASNKINLKSITAASLLSSILFFVITNFGVWAVDPTSIGLIETYILGIPFFGYSVAGDLLFNATLFGTLYFAQLKFPKLALA